MLYYYDFGIGTSLVLEEVAKGTLQSGKSLIFRTKSAKHHLKLRGLLVNGQSVKVGLKTANRERSILENLPLSSGNLNFSNGYASSGYIDAGYFEGLDESFEGTNKYLFLDEIAKGLIFSGKLQNTASETKELSLFFIYEVANSMVKLAPELLEKIKQENEYCPQSEPDENDCID
jgi:hypothetical protein